MALVAMYFFSQGKINLLSNGHEIVKIELVVKWAFTSRKTHKGLAKVGFSFTRSLHGS